jgi:hypothetical protein
LLARALLSPTPIAHNHKENHVLSPAAIARFDS